MNKLITLNKVFNFQRIIATHVIIVVNLKYLLNKNRNKTIVMSSHINITVIKKFLFFFLCLCFVLPKNPV